jgi:hypothetical protein
MNASVRAIESLFVSGIIAAVPWFTICFKPTKNFIMIKKFITQEIFIRTRCEDNPYIAINHRGENSKEKNNKKYTLSDNFINYLEYKQFF